MKIARERFIRFFDEKSKDEGHDGSDVTAIIGLLGEDLLLGVLQHYWKTNEGVESHVLSYKCTCGKEVHVFSASAYLQTLKDDYIDIVMPRVKKRMGLLSKLILSE